MGGRLSLPKSADKLSEAPANPASPSARFANRRINPRTVVAPLAAFTMAGLLFVYARTSIRAAKLNAQKHREADGGQISWHNESLRRHGQLQRVDNDRGTFGEALREDLNRTRGQRPEKAPEPLHKDDIERLSSDEAKLRKLMGKED